METFIKLNNDSFKSVETKTVEQIYDYKFLVQQKEMLLKRKTIEEEMINNELAKIDKLLAEAEKLGLSDKIVELSK